MLETRPEQFACILNALVLLDKFKHDLGVVGDLCSAEHLVPQQDVQVLAGVDPGEAVGLQELEGLLSKVYVFVVGLAVAVELLQLGEDVLEAFDQLCAELVLTHGERGRGHVGHFIQEGRDEETVFGR